MRTSQRSATSKTKSKTKSKTRSIKIKSNALSPNIQNSRQKSLYSPASKPKIIHKFMEMINCIKIFHWQTKSYAQHVASDKLYKELNENIDRFVEVLLGKTQSKIKELEQKLELYNECVGGTDAIRIRIFEFCEFLQNLDRVFDPKKDSDLFSIRDDILADLNQFLYLLDLK